MGSAPPVAQSHRDHFGETEAGARLCASAVRGRRGSGTDDAQSWASMLPAEHQPDRERCVDPSRQDQDRTRPDEAEGGGLARRDRDAVRLDAAGARQRVHAAVLAARRRCRRSPRWRRRPGASSAAARSSAGQVVCDHVRAVGRQQPGDHRRCGVEHGVSGRGCADERMRGTRTDTRSIPASDKDRQIDGAQPRAGLEQDGAGANVAVRRQHAVAGRDLGLEFRAHRLAQRQHRASATASVPVGSGSPASTRRGSDISRTGA